MLNGKVTAEDWGNAIATAVVAAGAGGVAGKIVGDSMNALANAIRSIGDRVGATILQSTGVPALIDRAAEVALRELAGSVSED